MAQRPYVWEVPMAERVLWLGEPVVWLELEEPIGRRPTWVCIAINPFEIN